MTQDTPIDHATQSLSFSNGVAIRCSQIVSIESTQQQISFPGSLGELSHLLEGRPSSLLVRLRDGSTVQVNAGHTYLQIGLTEDS